MELADFAGPRRRWADLMDEETNAVGPAAVHAAPRRRRRPPRQHRVRTLGSDADVHGNLLRLYVWLVFSGSRDVATLRCLQSARRVRGANVGVSVALALLLLVSLLHMRSVATDSSHCGRCFFYLFVRMHGAESKPVALCFSSRDALCLRQNKAIHSYICIAFCVAATRSIR